MFDERYLSFLPLAIFLLAVGVVLIGRWIVWWWWGIGDVIARLDRIAAALERRPPELPK